MESQASLCFLKLNRGNLKIRNEEKSYIKLFFINQLTRTPGFISQRNNYYQKLLDMMIKFKYDQKKYIEALPLIINKPHKIYLTVYRDLFNLLNDLRIGLLEATNNSFFIIGQNPVVLLNPYMKDTNFPWSTQGLDLKGLMMIMPISPKYSVILYDSLRYTLINKYPKWVIDSTDVEKLNNFQYCNTVDCIYYSKQIDEEKYRLLNNKYREYREGNKADFEIIASPKYCKAGYETDFVKTGLKEFPIEQKFSFFCYKAIEYHKEIKSYKDSIREHVEEVNLIRKNRLRNKQGE